MLEWAKKKVVTGYEATKVRACECVLNSLSCIIFSNWCNNRIAIKDSEYKDDKIDCKLH